MIFHELKPAQCWALAIQGESIIEFICRSFSFGKFTFPWSIEGWVGHSTLLSYHATVECYGYRQLLLYYRVVEMYVDGGESKPECSPGY